MTQWKKGESGNPAGRPRGVKGSATLVKMALQALDNAGGIEYLTRQAKDHPQAFLAFIAKAMPKDVNISPDTPFTDYLRALEARAAEFQPEGVADTPESPVPPAAGRSAPSA